MALVTSAEVTAWVAGDGVSVPAVDAGTMTACIAAAGEYINDYSSRVWESTAFTRYLNGDDAYGKNRDRLRLDRSHFPVTYPTDAVTVSENGSALTVGQGYSVSVGVIIENAGLEVPAVLVRQSALYGSGWIPGRQNILVTYKAGFATVPETIKCAARELTWLLYQEGRKVGIDNVTQGGSGRSLIHQLSALSLDILNGKRVYL